jgi:succinate dehydrogenase/fumarate reductase-like Fe-S protein
MAAKAVSAGTESEPSATDVYLIVMPMATYKTISDVAVKRNMTFSQALSKALSDFMQQDGPQEPKLLTEDGKAKVS